MSNLRVNDDDHPEAAIKHMADASALAAAQRFDGCGYLSGYVVECSLKSVILHDLSWVGGPPPTRDAAILQERSRTLSRRPYGHDLLSLATHTLGPEGNRYMPSLAPAPSVFTWEETIRYRASGSITEPQASAWQECARHFLSQTVIRMQLDGVL